MWSQQMYFNLMRMAQVFTFPSKVLSGSKWAELPLGAKIRSWCAPRRSWKDPQSRTIFLHRSCAGDSNWISFRFWHLQICRNGWPCISSVTTAWFSPTLHSKLGEIIMGWKQNRTGVGEAKSYQCWKYWKILMRLSTGVCLFFSKKNSSGTELYENLK